MCCNTPENDDPNLYLYTEISDGHSYSAFLNDQNIEVLDAVKLETMYAPWFLKSLA